MPEKPLRYHPETDTHTHTHTHIHNDTQIHIQPHIWLKGGLRTLHVSHIIHCTGLRAPWGLGAFYMICLYDLIYVFFCNTHSYVMFDQNGSAIAPNRSEMVPDHSRHSGTFFGQLYVKAVTPLRGITPLLPHGNAHLAITGHSI